MTTRIRLAAAAPPAPAAQKPPAPVAAVSSSNLWRGVIGVEGSPTGDGRMIEPGALGWQGLPIPIRYVRSDKGAHEGAVVVGRILTLAREGGQVIGTGDFDMGSEDGCEAQRQVALGLTTGVSMDLDNIAFEYRVAAELMSGMDDFDDDMLMMAADPDYPPLEPDIGGPGGAQTDALEPEADEAGRVTVMRVSPDDEMEVTTSARIRAATIVSLPAFSECRIEIVPAAEPAPSGDSAQAPLASDTDALPSPAEVVPGPGTRPSPPPATVPHEAHALAAAVLPVAPPAAWFADPHFAEPTPVEVTEDGRVRGHLAEWGTCHTGYADQCVSPPPSPSRYAYFRTGAILTREGTEIPVGQLTMDTRHASAEAGATSAMRHYDHTGTAVADVAAGEDAFGIWVAGALRPGVTPAQARTLRASPLSGDWRRIGGHLELVAALAVNVQGFPVPRRHGLVASGRLQALVASGMLAPRKVIPPGAPGAFSADDLRYLQRILAREKADAAALARGMAAVVRGPARAALRARAAALASSLTAGVGHVFEEAAHPRDHNGKFIHAGDAVIRLDHEGDPISEKRTFTYTGEKTRHGYLILESDKPNSLGQTQIEVPPAQVAPAAALDAHGNLRAAAPPPAAKDAGTDPALDPAGKQLPDTPQGTPPDPSYGGWLARGGQWVFDPENDGDDDYTAATDTDHDYWDASGKQLKAIPASPSGKQPAKDMPRDDGGQKIPPPQAAPASAATRISLRPFAGKA